MIYFDSFEDELISKETLKFIGNRNIITNIYRIQAYDSIMCEYFCIRSIDFMLKGKILLHYANLFSPSDYEKNDKTILKNCKRWENYIVLFVVSMENLKNLICHTS